MNKKVLNLFYFWRKCNIRVHFVGYWKDIKCLYFLSISIASRFFIGKRGKRRLKVRPRSFHFRRRRHDMTPYPSPYLASLLCVASDNEKVTFVPYTTFFLFRPSIPNIVSNSFTELPFKKKESFAFGFITTPRGAHYWLVLCVDGICSMFPHFPCADFHTGNQPTQSSSSMIWHGMQL